MCVWSKENNDSREEKKPLPVKDGRESWMKQLQLKSRVCLVWVLSSGPPSSSFAVNSTLDSAVWSRDAASNFFSGVDGKLSRGCSDTLANHGDPGFWPHISVAPGRVGPIGPGLIAGCTGLQSRS